ncbi:NaMN:DMB phosphoribosyltransferase (CobT) (PDB:1D0S) [Commensalibacter communis]|uniref:Nicotinate-nucleotide--dimethylbenzimidazole phosphoribosyltransferase n=1 Tax=Commensalibacter communis TaxID=2972786 RepID=A0A9W4X5Q5_9PROT|nr:nicotinate-nucleotide--dimethylbenzimidazole phosphoribosyltransferase [Commensalibacter communis]CAI3922167.1 NaMN:DMB phosphoribosyltransferase (CobT) (PDB:1D0S) [Commensalibacter communis]CAI3922853.1 NaMN:DMB phosphoribosyltransferase (CobT) (PDB:1D0S) [Commensalibacter communis]CAI3939697.1 NaMN:DMB phosphoribosyltransferase (CobT) (PDB:1D0S) [Commensalibacter communis]CAI3940276.1 NaMN:DMB phosphoribosyltransferase (CobT) (PDB:1D0S) [Commensalibacter communis]
MKNFETLDQFRQACLDLSSQDDVSEQATYEKQKTLLKPPGSLGELENLVGWLAAWQNKPNPTLDRVCMMIFAGNHGVTAENVTPYPASITELMVAQINQGGAAINQLVKNANAELRVIPVNNLEPTANITQAPAMTEKQFLQAVEAGYNAVTPNIDLLCLGEVGIGNTTIAAALSAALFGGDGSQWVSKGTSTAAEHTINKQKAVDKALALHESFLHDPLETCRRLGGYEHAALLGAVLAARHLNIPVLLDGFVCTAAIAALQKLNPVGLDHTKISHLSAEKGHLLLAGNLGLYPLIAFNMRLGEGTGAATVVPLLKGALACYTGMNSYQDAGLPSPQS